MNRMFPDLQSVPKLLDAKDRWQSILCHRNVTLKTVQTGDPCLTSNIPIHTVLTLFPDNNDKRSIHRFQSSSHFSFYINETMYAPGRREEKYELSSLIFEEFFSRAKEKFLYSDARRQRFRSWESKRRERRECRNVRRALHVKGARPLMAKSPRAGQDQSTWRTRFSLRSRDRDSRPGYSLPD